MWLPWRRVEETISKECIALEEMRYKQVGDEVPRGQRIFMEKIKPTDNYHTAIAQNGLVIWAGSVDELCEAVRS
jgi:hypothetical protein